MSWRVVVITKRAKLDLQLNHLVIRGETVKKIHLGEISTLIVESTEVSLTAALLAELINLKIKVVFCDAKRNPCSELVGYYGSCDTSSKLRQQIQWSKENKDAVWTEIIRAKIANQAEILQALDYPEYVLLEKYLYSLTPGDVTNREAMAAKTYFTVLFGEGFTRAADIYVNAALNYGYAILLSACNREIVAQGYITQLGIHHDNVFNVFNLGSDLMEPFRPFLDLTVWRLHTENKLEDFSQKEKLTLIDVLNQTVIFNGQKQVLNFALKKYCKSVFDALNEEDISLIKFCRREKSDKK